VSVKTGQKRKQPLTNTHKGQLTFGNPKRQLQNDEMLVCVFVNPAIARPVVVSAVCKSRVPFLPKNRDHVQYRTSNRMPLLCGVSFSFMGQGSTRAWSQQNKQNRKLAPVITSEFAASNSPKSRTSGFEWKHVLCSPGLRLLAIYSRRMGSGFRSKSG
jgi:hypothetical protein